MGNRLVISILSKYFILGVRISPKGQAGGALQTNSSAPMAPIHKIPSYFCRALRALQYCNVPGTLQSTPQKVIRGSPEKNGKKVAKNFHLPIKFF
jgi:hypothetical protein